MNTRDGRPAGAGHVFVLVGGWPGSGKSTLAAALAGELDLPLLAKDEIKEALMDGLGRPRTVAESQRLGRAAGRHAGHLDDERSERELWGLPAGPLGLAPALEVDTSGPVDVPRLAASIARGLAEA